MFKKLTATLLALLMLFTVFAVPVAQAEDPIVAEDINLRIHYKFNGDLLDSQRDLLHAVNAGGAGFIEDSQFGTVLNLPGGNTDGNSYLTIPGEAFGGTSPVESMTVSCWLYNYATLSFARLFEFGTDLGNTFWYCPTTGANARATINADGKDEVDLLAPLISRLKWTHVAISLDAQNKTLTYFVNGVETAKTECNYSFADIRSEDPEKNVFYIGKTQGDDALLNARLYDFRVYDVVKTAAEVTEIMNDPLSDQAKVNNDVAAISLGTTRNRTEDVVLPTKGAAGSTFVWESNNADVIDPVTGKLTRPAADSASATASVKLTVTATLNGATSTKSFTITVPKALTDDAKVAADVKALTLSNLSAVTSDITLPTVGTNGSVITWTSSNAAIAPDGKVTRPASTEENAAGTLTATVTSGEASDTKSFDFAVIRHPSDKDYVDSDLAAIDLGDLSSCTGDLTLATVGASGETTIEWTSSNPAVIAADGKVTRPAADSDIASVDVKLTATVKKGEAAATKEFDVTVIRTYMDLVLTNVADITATTMVGYLPKLPYYIPGTYVDGLGKEVVGPEVRVNWYGYQVAAGADKFTETPATDAKAFMNVGDVIEVRGLVPEWGADRYVTAYVTVVPYEETVGPTKDIADFHLSKVHFNNYENGEKSVFARHQENFIYKLTNVAAADSFLYMFRYTFGEDNPQGKALGSWDTAGTLLRGHATGHYISALSQSYADTLYDEDQTLHNKIGETLDYVVGELYKLSKLSKGNPEDVTANPAGSVIQGAARRTDYENWGEGFISAYPPDQFVMLENGAGYSSSPDGIWAPYYTLHKILAGLISCYKNTGNEQALEIAEGMGLWVYKRLKNVSRTNLYNIWNRYIAGEYGGMNEVMVDLYEISGKEEYLTGAKLFDNLAFFYGADGVSGLANNVDTIRTRHANQHLPQIVGSLKIYEASGEKKYYDIADNFFDYALNSYSYSIGGVAGNVTNAECFNPLPNMISQVLHDATPNMCETCATYNMLKLSRQLFMFTGDAKYMDYYERAWYNQIAASVNDDCGNTYHIPLDGGSAKSYGNANLTGFTCCNGTAIETNTKLQDTIYFHEADNSKLYINMYAPSTLDWDGVTVTQETNFPYGDTVKIVISGGGKFDLLARVPSWATNGYNVKVNGIEQSVIAVPSSYVCLGYEWNDGDVIEIEMPMSLHILKTMDDPNVGSIFYGPILLAGSETSSLPALRQLTLNERDLAADIKVDPATLHATIGDYTLKPFWEYITDRHSVYFRFNFTRLNYEEVSYDELNRAINAAEALEGSFEGSAAVDEAYAAAAALNEAKGATQRDVNAAAAALVSALQSIGSRLEVISVNDIAGNTASVGRDNTITVKMFGPEAEKLGLFNEAGKGIGSSSEYADGVWTTTFTLGSKGDRTISICFKKNGEWVDSGLDLLLNVTETVYTPEVPGEVVSIETKNTNIFGHNKPIKVTVVTKGDVSKIGLFNENGVGIGKSLISKTAEGDETTWVFQISVSSKGRRTICAKVPTSDGSWSDDGAELNLIIV